MAATRFQSRLHLQHVTILRNNNVEYDSYTEEKQRVREWNELKFRVTFVLIWCKGIVVIWT